MIVPLRAVAVAMRYLFKTLSFGLNQTEPAVNGNKHVEQTP